MNLIGRDTKEELLMSIKEHDKEFFINLSINKGPYFYADSYEKAQDKFLKEFNRKYGNYVNLDVER